MASRKEVAKAQVFLDGKQAEAAIDALKLQSKELREELKKAVLVGDKKSEKKLKAQIRSVDAATRSLKRETFDYQSVLKNINGASFNELNKALKTTQSQLRKLKRTDAGYAKKEAEVRALRSEITRLNTNTRATTSTWSQFQNSFNKNFGIVTAGIAAFTGIAFSIKEFVSGLVGLDDSLANVIKTTGLARKAVRGIYTDFKQLNTRTKNSVLLQYAEEAGRLGKKSKEDVMGFVREANKIGTALGDDLGNAPVAIRTVGKLVGMYKVGIQYGVDFNEGMNKVGSAINEIAANSSASAPYQIDYLKRLAGTAQQAKITADQVLGYSSVLDQNGQAVEMAATAQNKLMIDMFTSPGQYADIAGMKVTEFTDLLKNDANEAFLLFLEGINGNDEGFMQMSTRLDELGIEGARAVSVISLLAGNTAEVRKEQLLANEAMKAGTSLTNEYNIKNDNLAGSWEKIQKKMRSIFTNTKLIETFEGLVSKLSISMEDGSFDKFLKNIKNITIATIAYIVVQKLSTKSLIKNISLTAIKNTGLKVQRSALLLASAAQALFTGNVTRANAALRLFNITTKLNPTLLLISALTAAGIALYNYSKKLNIAKKATSEIISEYHLESVALNNLFVFAKKAASGTDERKKAIDSINTKYGKYLENLLTEKSTLEDIEKAQRRATGALLSEIGVKISKEKLETELTEIAKTFDDEFSNFNEVITENYGAALLPNFLKDINTAIETEIKDGGGKIERGVLESSSRAKNIYDKYISEISRKTGYLKYSFDDFKTAFLDFAEFKADKSTVVSTLNGMVDAYSSMINYPQKESEEDDGKKKKKKKTKTTTLSDDEIKALTTALDQQWLERKMILEKQYAEEGVISDLNKTRILASELAYLKTKQELLETNGKDSLAVRQKIHDAELSLENQLYTIEEQEMIAQWDAMLLQDQAEIDALIAKNKALEEQTDEHLTNMATKRQADLNDQLRKYEQIMGIGQDVGTMLGETIADSQETMADFGKNMVLMALQTMKAMIPIWAAQIVGGSMATPQSIATGGIVGIAQAATLSTLMYAAVAGVEATVRSSMNEGYYDGGFTPNVDPKKVVGPVHGGEWVANHKTLANPRARQIIDSLDIAQRNGTIGQMQVPDMLTSVSRGYSTLTSNSVQSDNTPQNIVSTPTPETNTGNTLRISLFPDSGDTDMTSLSEAIIKMAEIAKTIG